MIARAHGNHALLYGGHDPAVCGMGQGGVALWMLGYPDQAVDSVRQGMTLADDLAHPPSVGQALWFAGIVYMMRGDAIAALDLAERLIRLSSEHGLAQYRAVGEHHTRLGTCPVGRARTKGLVNSGSRSAATKPRQRRCWLFS